MFKHNSLYDDNLADILVVALLPRLPLPVQGPIITYYTYTFYLYLYFRTYVNCPLTFPHFDHYLQLGKSRWPVILYSTNIVWSLCPP